MRLLLCTIGILISATWGSVEAATLKLICNPETTPKIINRLENWEIISGNVAHIKTTNAFKGKDLIYSFSAHPKNKENKININSKTGEISIKAEAKDNFDVQIVAKNSCGSTSNTFNVIIDEEE